MLLKYKKKTIPLLIALIVLAAGFVVNAYVSAKVLPRDATTNIYVNRTSGPVFVTFNESKNWLEDAYFHGGQYDFTIHNNSDADISGWRVTLPLTDDIRVIKEEDIWNVSEYEQTPDSLTVQPDEMVSEIKSGEMKTFGMVLTSDVPYNPKALTITVHYIYHATKRPAFTMLVVLLLLWLLWATMVMSELRVQRKNEAREKHDKDVIIQTMGTFTNFIDAKDPYTKGHSQRVAAVAAELARRMGMNDKEVAYVYYAGILHDSGKIGIPDNILKKVGILTPEEYEIIKTHAEIGGQMLKDFTSISGIREGALYHHERYDGTGYPKKLKGEDIPLFGRIICVADTYDAMARDRCYRKHLPTEKILSEFKECSGTQFDPRIARIMVEMISDGTAEAITKDI